MHIARLERSPICNDSLSESAACSRHDERLIREATPRKIATSEIVAESAKRQLMFVEHLTRSMHRGTNTGNFIGGLPFMTSASTG